MQLDLQFCNANHAMVALDPWFQTIILTGKREATQQSLIIEKTS